MTDIQRTDTSRRMSQIVDHGNLIWLAGKCGAPHTSVREQTETVLSIIDNLLAEAGTDKTKILQVTIWLSNVDGFEEMNAVWDTWLPDGCAPVRACGEFKLAGEGWDIEIICVVAK